MAWNCSECGDDVVSLDADEHYVWVGSGGIDWLCGECKQTVSWKRHLDMYDDNGNFSQ